MALQSPNLSALRPDAGSSVLPHAVLENLAARFRPGGLFLVVLRQDGSVAWHDAGAGVFFERYVLPMLRDAGPGAQALRQQIASLEAGAAVGAWQLPGASLAAFAHVEKRQAAGVIVLAAKSSTFGPCEDVLRACSRLGLDGPWLFKQAEELPAYGEEAIQKQGRLLAGTLRDQVRLSGLENELNSLSGQLANTYEELSLIYQVSSGMKINRRASDFFRQACLDVLEAMCVRGMGVALHGDDARRQEPVLYGQMSLPPGQVHRLSDELLVQLCQRKSPILINDLSRDKTFHWLGGSARQLLAVPLQRQEQVLGCL